MAEFEFDDQKNIGNKHKHGIDFVEAQKIWDDPDALELSLKTTEETRSMVIGTKEGKHWSVIITHRGEKIRIISARRSRPEEVALYES